MITLIFLVYCGENIQEQPSQNTQVKPKIATTQLVGLQNTQSSKKPEVFVQLGHSSDVNSVAFSPDGKLALSGSWDGSIRFWNIETGKKVAKMVGIENGEWVTSRRLL